MSRSYLTALVGAFVLISIVTGCDTVGDDTITFREEVDFRFEFSTEDVAAGEEVVVTSLEPVDFADFLVDEGFTKDEIIVANVRSVTVDRISPAGVSLSAFDEIAFTLSATGLNVPIIAESGDLPDEREASLTVRVPGVTEVLWQPVFLGRLTVVPAADDDEQYVLTVSMDVAVQAEGV